MIMIGIFEQSIELEQALAVLEKDFVSRNQIMLVFLDNKPMSAFDEFKNLRDVVSNSFEVGMACATGCAVIGACVGFILTWGPIIWGLIGTLSGFTVGYSLYYFSQRRKTHSKSPVCDAEAAVMIQCTEEQLTEIKKILWKYHALAVGQLNDQPKEK